MANTFGVKSTIGLVWDAGRTPPATASAAIPCGAILLLASGKNWFGVATQAIAAGQRYSLIREGYVRLPVGSTFTITAGAKVPVVANSSGYYEIGDHSSGDTAYYIGRACETLTSGSSSLLVELVDFEDPS